MTKKDDLEQYNAILLEKIGGDVQLIAEQHGILTERIEKMDSKIDRLDSKVDKLDSKIDRIDKKSVIRFEVLESLLLDLGREVKLQGAKLDRHDAILKAIQSPRAH